jgi:hypothetical protein
MIKITTRGLYFILAFAVLISLSLLWVVNHSKKNSSPLIQEITAYEESHKDENPVDLTTIIQRHLKTDMTLDEVTLFFQKMGFQLHKSYKDKTEYVADFRRGVGPNTMNIVHTYRFRLYFADDKLKKFDGSAYTEGP